MGKQVKNAKYLKMSLKDYYKLLGNVQSDFKDKVLEALEISEKTFYNRLNADKWTNIERDKIAQITNDTLTSIRNAS
jgi:hypothetical protein